MILTGKMFEDAMSQINEAFAQVNKKVDKLQDEVKALSWRCHWLSPLSGP